MIRSLFLLGMTHVVMALVPTLFAGAVPAYAADSPAPPAAPELIAVGDRELQQVFDAAPDHSTIQCNRNRVVTLSAPLVIRKPLNVQGLNAELPAALGKTPLVVVEADGVSFTDFFLRGNADTVDQKDRSPLLVVRASNFRVERGEFVNSSKDGLCIDGAGVPDKDIVNGIVRDIVGRGVIRDVISISGGGEHGRRIRHVLVDNVQGYDSKLRGAVEVSDGTDYITVRKVYAEKSVYAVDVQDHSKPQQINTNVLLEDITAVDSSHIIRTNNKPLGHSSLTIRNVVGERCALPLKLSNTQDLTLENAIIVDHPNGKPPISIVNGDGVSVRNVVIRNSAHEGAGIVLEDTNDATIDGVRIQGSAAVLANAIAYRIAGEKIFSGLRIQHVFAPAIKGPGIVLERAAETAKLTDVLISGNQTSVQDGINGERTVIDRNY
jgi:hypothetical protein